MIFYEFKIFLIFRIQKAKSVLNFTCGVRFRAIFILCDFLDKKISIYQIISYNRITTKPQRRFFTMHNNDYISNLRPFYY